MINHKQEGEFNEFDNEGYKISFKILKSTKKKIKKTLIGEFVPLVIKVAHKGIPVEIMCSSNNKFVTDKLLSLEKEGHAFMLNDLDREEGNWVLNKNEETLVKPNKSDFYYGSLGQKKIANVEFNLVKSIYVDFFKNETSFDSRMFKHSYKTQSRNIYEVINELFFDDVFEYFSSVLPCVMRHLDRHETDIYEICDILIEIDERNSSESLENSLIDDFQSITMYSLQVVTNINLIDNTIQGLQISSFQLYDNYLRGIGFCIPVPSMNSFKLALMALGTLTELEGQGSTDQVILPFRSTSMLAYFPYYLWDKYIDTIIDEKIDHVPKMQENVKKLDLMIRGKVLE